MKGGKLIKCVGWLNPLLDASRKNFTVAVKKKNKKISGSEMNLQQMFKDTLCYDFMGHCSHWLIKMIIIVIFQQKNTVFRL